MAFCAQILLGDLITMNTLPDNTLHIHVPEMTIEHYAAHVGVSTRTVNGWINRGYLPSIKLGKRRLVNVAQRTIDCINSEVR